MLALVTTLTLTVGMWVMSGTASASTRPAARRVVASARTARVATQRPQSIGVGSGTPAIVPGSASVIEGNTATTALHVPVTLSFATANTVTAGWTTLFAPGAPGNQADPASDYTATSGTVTFTPGQTTQSVAISVNGDTLVEPDEYILVALSNPANATIGGFFGLGFGGITNDDHAVVVPGSASVLEGNSGTTDLNVPVTLSNPSTQTVTAQWTTVFVPQAPGNQADPATDYTAASGTVTFTPGQTTQSVTISVNGDTSVEPDEYIVVEFSNPANATMGGFFGLGFGVITNDDLDLSDLAGSFDGTTAFDESTPACTLIHQVEDATYAGSGAAGTVVLHADACMTFPAEGISPLVATGTFTISTEAGTLTGTLSGSVTVGPNPVAIALTLTPTSGTGAFSAPPTGTLDVDGSWFSSGVVGASDPFDGTVSVGS